MQVNEGGVEIVHTFNPISQSVEDYAYSRPGKRNAISALKLLELTFSSDEEFRVTELSLSVPIQQLFPHCCEYLVRFGWMPGGDSVWVQLLNREQTHLIIAVLSIASFTPETSQQAPYVYILWEEKSSIWITVIVRANVMYLLSRISWPARCLIAWSLCQLTRVPSILVFCGCLSQLGIDTCTMLKQTLLMSKKCVLHLFLVQGLRHKPLLEENGAS